jgi:dipeptidyl aminopeptidase/acylaminoacyl peptidase
MNHINKWKTPQLVIHGEKDYRLCISEGIAMFNTLQRLGIPSRFLVFENENHWVSDYLWREVKNLRVAKTSFIIGFETEELIAVALRGAQVDR